MTDAATEVKNVRSRTATALDRLRAAQARRHPDEDWAPAVPASQRGQVAEWIAELADISARLERLDPDAWKTTVRTEILPGNSR
ncbi:hypothetical protein GCM10017673_38560 [Streptosporangium violaceochromogenes]|nr:hypothetical protein GCM10017673_38560 [Streptosporangium violaceochromogenes]